MNNETWYIIATSKSIWSTVNIVLLCSNYSNSRARASGYQKYPSSTAARYWNRSMLDSSWTIKKHTHPLQLPVVSTADALRVPSSDELQRWYKRPSTQQTYFFHANVSNAHRCTSHVAQLSWGEQCSQFSAVIAQHSRVTCLWLARWPTLSNNRSYTTWQAALVPEKLTV